MNTQEFDLTHDIFGAAGANGYPGACPIDDANAPSKQWAVRNFHLALQYARVIAGPDVVEMRAHPSLEESAKFVLLNMPGIDLALDASLADGVYHLVTKKGETFRVRPS